MSDNLKVAKECGAMKDGDTVGFYTLADFEAYTSRILASQQAAHDAEIARLKEENELYRAEMSQAKAAGWHSASELFSAYNTLERKLSAANAACARKDEALKVSHAWLHSAYNIPPQTPEAVAMLQSVSLAISASPQQVSEWELKQLEPLRAQVAMLHNRLTNLRDQIHEFAVNVGEADFFTGDATEAIVNTQAAAEQFIAECEQRGAEQFKELLLEATMSVVHPHIEGVFAAYQSRATSKKAG